MDVLKKLKSVFIVEDGSTIPSDTPVKETIQPEANPSIKEATQSSTSSTVSQTQPTFDTSSLKSKAPDEKFMNILLDAIDKANLPGFDYIEYKTSLQSLGKMNMDVPTKYQSAMAMAKTMGATPEKIIQAANQYLSVLKEENDKFLQAVQGQKQKVAQDEKDGVSGLQNSIADKKNQIALLQKEIASQEASLAKMKDEIGASAHKIAETSAKFDQAYVAVTQQIVDDIKNISQYASN
jgi:uncharacterized small protein (DUF1192 family)